MAERLILEFVTAGRAPTVQLGQITFDDDRLSGDTARATDLIEMLRRRTRLPDPELFARLSRDGWSNGAMRIAI